MMDFDKLRGLEVDIDRLLMLRDPQINMLAKQAADAMKRRDYPKAAVLVERASILYNRPLTVSDALKRGQVSSTAEARRLVESGTVLLNSRVCRDFKAALSSTDVVEVHGTRVHP